MYIEIRAQHHRNAVRVMLFSGENHVHDIFEMRIEKTQESKRRFVNTLRSFIKSAAKPVQDIRTSVGDSCKITDRLLPSSTWTMAWERIESAHGV